MKLLFLNIEPRAYWTIKTTYEDLKQETRDGTDEWRWVRKLVFNPKKCSCLFKAFASKLHGYPQSAWEHLTHIRPRAREGNGPPSKDEYQSWQLTTLITSSVWRRRKSDWKREAPETTMKPFWKRSRRIKKERSCKGRGRWCQIDPRTICPIFFKLSNKSYEEMTIDKKKGTSSGQRHTNKLLKTNFLHVHL